MGGADFHDSTTVSAFISETTEIDVTAVIRATVDTYFVTVSTPVSSGSALATVNSVAITRIGSNLLCMEGRILTLTSQQYVSHSQVITMTYDLGPVTNPDFAARSSFLLPSNDTMEEEIDFIISVQITDHVMNVQGALVAIETTLTGQSGVSYTSQSYVQVQVSGTETPELIFDFAMEQFSHWEKIPGDNVTCSVSLRLTNTSTAHALDVALHIMTPYYIGLSELPNVTTADANVITYLPEPGLKLSIWEIDFTDVVTFSIMLMLDPNRKIPIGSTNVETVIPVDLTYRGAVRADRAATGVIYTDILVNEFGFDTELPDVLGLQSGAVLDCQMTASSYLDPNTPSSGRLITGIGWKPSVRGEPFCGSEWLQVDFGSDTYVTGFKLQSSNDDAQDVVSSFTVKYSLNGYAWYDITEMDGVTPKSFTLSVPGNANRNDVYDVTLLEKERFSARYIRVVSTDVRCTVGLRLEVLGVKSTTSAYDCSSVTSNTSPLPEQSYVVNTDTGTILVCGASEVDGDVVCSKSDDAGTSWQPLDDNIGNIVAVVTNTSYIIAVSHDNSSYLLSEDDGVTWDILANEELAELQTLPGYLTSISFPYADYRGETDNEMYAVYGTDGDGFKLTGTLEGMQ
ncbi:uncharacterized protein LOC128218506 [Mya arenaria]|uniref:uncharacterized protein LOC128218506 n=1 Tax=Mya arenaria TaxID=6604 RepID=UPI0022E57E48|nr:uncharacterized protein LOC128218506 [Mya arenaria]